jgi:predicted alpha/beta superfamily hydrolase
VNQISIPENCIVVSIHHTGNIKEGRNRDLIPSDIRKNGKENYGQAHSFYLFMKEELVPFVSRLFPHASEKVFIGHSLSGLFCLYMTFQDDSVFDHFYAISPSVWANHFELLQIEKAYNHHHHDLKRAISVYYGSLELFNLIRISTQKYLSAIRKRNYEHLHLEYTMIQKMRHFTVRKPALELIMNSLKQ